MPLIAKLRQYLPFSGGKPAEPAHGYDLWSESYDNQPDNLMLALDEAVCGQLLAATPLTGRIVADIGCGTGRHWKKIYDRNPARLVGYDVSEGMLGMLRKKYPQAETHLLQDGRLPYLDTASCDLVLSTLTIAHIPDIRMALAEWVRVLRPGGEMIFSDYHPAALARGGQRTFREGDKVIAVRNHVYPLPWLRRLARRLGLTELRVVEKSIDETMRHYYEKQQALHVYERFRGVPIIYGLHLKKVHAAE